MPGIPSVVGRWLLPVAFLMLASSAGLQWAGLNAQSEAARHHGIVQRLNDFSALLVKLQSAPEAEQDQVARQVTGYAERLGSSMTEEPLRASSRRVTALAAYDGNPVRERLRAEVRDMVEQAEHLETAALRRANTYAMVTQGMVLVLAAFCGALWLRRQTPEPSGNRTT